MKVNVAHVLKGTLEESFRGESAALVSRWEMCVVRGSVEKGGTPNQRGWERGWKVEGMSKVTNARRVGFGSDGDDMYVSSWESSSRRIGVVQGQEGAERGGFRRSELIKNVRVFHCRLFVPGKVSICF